MPAGAGMGSMIKRDVLEETSSTVAADPRILMLGVRKLSTRNGQYHQMR